MSSHRRRLLWTLAYLLSVSEHLARTYFKIQHWHAALDFQQKLHNKLCYARATSWIGFRLSSGLFMSFSSRQCIFLCLLISPSALNDHHPGEREREEQSLLVTFLPNRDQGWTGAPCNIFIIFTQARGRENSMSFCFVPHRVVYVVQRTFTAIFFLQSFSMNVTRVSLCYECYEIDFDHVSFFPYGPSCTQDIH